MLVLVTFDDEVDSAPWWAICDQRHLIGDIVQGNRVNIKYEDGKLWSAVVEATSNSKSVLERTAEQIIGDDPRFMFVLLYYYYYFDLFLTFTFLLFNTFSN